jgi:two-component system KDP operon response regulator KdpE
MAAKILIVDDEPEMVRFLERALSGEGYEVQSALDGREGLHKVYAFRPDLVLLDVMMPVMTGWEMLGHLREFCDVPVIMLTAIHGEEAVVRGLDGGADDYLAKPFRVQELRARVRATLRRAELPRSEPDSVFRFDGGQLTIDPTGRQVSVQGKAIDLTPTEYKLLYYLACNAGQVLTYGQILDNVWGPGREESLATLKVFVRQLRLKIEEIPGRPRYLLTERGIGYQLAKI